MVIQLFVSFLSRVLAMFTPLSNFLFCFPLISADECFLSPLVDIFHMSVSQETLQCLVKMTTTHPHFDEVLWALQRIKGNIRASVDP